MSNKKVSFSKPNKEKEAEKWIQEGGEKTPNSTPSKPKEKEPLQRMTFDIPKSWHTKIKVACAEKGVKMNEEILPLLKKHFSIND